MPIDPPGNPFADPLAVRQARISCTHSEPFPFVSVGPFSMRETGISRRHPWRKGGSPSNAVPVGHLAMREAGFSRRPPWRKGESVSDVVAVGSAPTQRPARNFPVHRVAETGWPG